MRQLFVLVLLLFASCSAPLQRQHDTPSVAFDQQLHQRVLVVDNPTSTALRLHLDCDSTIADFVLEPGQRWVSLAHPWDRSCTLWEVR